ncbi:glycoside hydrolase family 31 protein [Pigmentibacter sp. JX0631]|uniref:TIM-barrel domain-containing protein n=1 Tax=Pigmentibacter sp. JX0631 TaxID=2976982 RepID=UPI00246836B8|nr:TIM-barrel domain-containing protein [Pigmentibacter sp. JX0631]WGL61256.1 glycoside hydrolase family 31 protein [Pigmentibacter sp. JX0631]
MKINNYKFVLTAGVAFFILSFNYNFAFARKKLNLENSSTQFYSNNNYLVVEAYSDDIIHIELGKGDKNSIKLPLYTTPMISSSTLFRGPEKFQKTSNSVETNSLAIKINSDLCISFFNKKLSYSLANICPENLDQPTKDIYIQSDQNRNAYGLGQYFYDPNYANGDWIGRKWEPGEFGNSFIGFAGGANSKIQFPILYALGNDKQNYAIFIDNQYKMSWDFTNTSKWKVSMWGDQIRYFIIAGKNLEELRQKYLSLTGNPLVPPKKMLGLWISEYGYHNWDEVNVKLDHLRKNNFPVDGFALDLYWFGGTKGMGTVSFDPYSFPNAAQNVKKYKEQGVEFIPIQESYISENALAPSENKTDYSELQRQCFLVRKNNTNCTPVYFKDTWWGSGGMIDWTNPQAGDYWFAKKEVPLIQMGINQFWLDLNEPEMYDSNAYYYGLNINGVLKNRHADVANLYAFKWIESIYRGYLTKASDPKFQTRPIFISRAGAPGMQRFGAGMWSGDIGANLGAIKAHINNQMNVSLSGIDFYSADTGGFHRNAFDGNDIQKLYTMWFANAAHFDFPIRPHTWMGETDNSETTPSLIGDFNSNKENLLQRYSLSPYYYSLFYRAYLYGEAVIPPLVSEFQDDLMARANSSEKLIGKFLLASSVYQYNDPIRKDIYLPAGRWLNYHTLDEVTATGKTFLNFPTYIDSKFKVPLFIREGAIIPQMLVDDKTLNISGLRKDFSQNNDLILKIFPSENPTSFVLYEDDGESIDYKSSKFSQTVISQKKNSNLTSIVINPTKGSYNGFVANRNISIELALPSEEINSVFFANNKVPVCTNNKNNCWIKSSRNSYSIYLSNITKNNKTELTVSSSKINEKYTQYSFSCLNAQTNIGESIYIVGNIPELGNWNIENAIKLNPVDYPNWNVYLPNIPSNTKNIEWKCVKKKDNKILQWQQGTNNSFQSTDKGYGGSLTANF